MLNSLWAVLFIWMRRVHGIRIWTGKNESTEIENMGLFNLPQLTVLRQQHSIIGFLMFHHFFHFLFINSLCYFLSDLFWVSEFNSFTKIRLYFALFLIQFHCAAVFYFLFFGKNVIKEEWKLGAKVILLSLFFKGKDNINLIFHTLFVPYITSQI